MKLIKTATTQYQFVWKLQHLFKKRIFLFVSTTGIYDDYFKILCFEYVHTFLSDDCRVNFCVAEI